MAGKGTNNRKNGNNLFELIKSNIDINGIIKKYGRLKTSRTPWESKWKMIQDYIYPSLRNYTDAKIGINSPAKTSYINFTSSINGKVTRVVSQINSQLCDPSVKWLDMKFVDPIYLADGSVVKLSQNDAAKRWLEEAVEIIYKELSDPGSNFYPSTHEFLYEWYTIGTGCREVIIRQDTGKLRFNAVSMQNVYIDTNGYGEVENVYRVFNVNAKQAYDLWGENIHESEKRKLATSTLTGDSNQTKEYVEVSMKNPAVEAGIPSLPYLTCVIDKSNKIIVDIKIHREKPYIISRFFMTPGEIYGRSPVWNAMPDIITLNRISKRILQAYDYALSPPILVRDITSIANYQMSPNSYVQGLDEHGRAMMQPMNIGSNLPFSIEYYNAKMNDLDEVLMARDIFAPESPNMTATEVNERKIQASNRIRPILVRLEYEDLNNTIIKTFTLLLEMGKIGTFPYEEAKISAELMPDPLTQIKISFSGQMARMQRMQDIQNNEIILGKVLNAAQVSNEILDRINIDALIAESANILGISPKVMNSEEEVKAIREARAEQEKQQAEMAMESQRIENEIKMKEAGLNEVEDYG